MEVLELHFLQKDLDISLFAQKKSAITCRPRLKDWNALS